jgi:hypothetical protein
VTAVNKALASHLAVATKDKAALADELRRVQAQKARLEALCRALRVRFGVGVGEGEGAVSA